MLIIDICVHIWWIHMSKTLKSKNMQQLSLFLPKHMINGLDEAVKKGYASDRSRAIRDAIRDYLKDLELWVKEE